MSASTTIAPTRRPPRERKDPPAVRVTGPRIAALAEERARTSGESARADLVDAFWATVDDRTVIVEEISSEAAADRCVVTFLLRASGDDDARAAFVLANKLTPPSVPDAARMARLRGTDVLHASYEVPRSWRGTYRITAGPAIDPASNPVIASGIASMPDAPARPWLGRTSAPMRRVPISATELDAPRACWIHHAGDTAAPPRVLVVLLDGETWGERAPIAPCIDHLTHTGALPPCVIVAPQTGDRAQRYRELGDATPALTRFLSRDIHAWFTHEYGTPPEHAVIIGQSLGALAAARAAHDPSGAFDAALLQSPSLWLDDDAPVSELADLLEAGCVGTAASPSCLLGVGTDEWVLLPRAQALIAELDARGCADALTAHTWAGGHDIPCWLDGIAAHLPTLVPQDIA